MNRLISALVLAFAFSATPALGQTAPPYGYKDPGTSTLISVLVPGGGHLYSGETRKGATLLGVGLGGLVVGVAMTTSSVSASCDSFSCSDDTNYAPMALGYLAYFGTWIYGIVDAGDSAHRMNARRGFTRLLPESVSPLVEPGSGGGTGLGLSVRF